MAKQIKIEWTPSASNTVAPTSQVVERSATENGTYSVIHTASNNTTDEYIDTTVVDGETWWYKVGAVFASGNTVYLSADDITVSDGGSAAWDLDTMTHSSSDVGSTVTGLQSISFNPDKSKMFYSKANETTIRQSTLTAGDITTLVAGTSHTVSEAIGSISGIAWNSDGSVMYLNGYDGVVWQYNCSSSYDPTTATYVQNNDFSDTPFMNISFNSNGTKVYWCSQYSNEVKQSTLSTAWDITTAGSITDFTHSSGVDGFNISGDGNSCFIMEKEGYVRQRELSTAGDVTTLGAIIANEDVTGLFTNSRSMWTDGVDMYLTNYSTGEVYQYKAS